MQPEREGVFVCVFVRSFLFFGHNKNKGKRRELDRGCEWRKDSCGVCSINRATSHRVNVTEISSHASNPAPDAREDRRKRKSRGRDNRFFVYLLVFFFRISKQLRGVGEGKGAKGEFEES